ncbi:recombinase family protein [Caloranaerobacter ferrireducens]|uniref:recombinase family protein n=1 Tax=Caloranaerobacter ferrireducens TaxID=1323370 RepID=UPI00084DB87B|nr:recombinase family protein [Caloranaerobacter ferrireducens]
MVKKVSIIPAKPIAAIKGLPKETKKRVCAYCRVSTDTDEQLSSYEAQVTYYEDYIRKRPDWEYAGIYADEGITGTNTKYRAQFNRMIEDAMAGQFDMIITKSISRFARNTLDCLKYVRILKEKGIGVYFEKENIDTMDSKGEVLLTILSSLAQDESRSISENSRWGIVRRFQQGKVRVNHKKFMGYDKDENGELIINEEQAKIVRRIFKEYLQGKSADKIAAGLMKDGILTVTGKKKWHPTVITKMLKNEKYCGDALLQKTITVDFLTHKRVKNEGQAPQYYVENSHPAIITKEMFEAVQKEMKRRSKLRGFGDKERRSKHSSKYPFSGKIICSSCGAVYRRKRWGPTNKYKKYVWNCRTRDENGPEACNMKAVDEEKLKAAFVRVVNKVIKDSDGFIKKMMGNIEKVLNENKDEAKLKTIDSRLAELREQITNLIRLNSRSSIDSDIYDEEYNRLVLEMENLRSQRLAYTKTEMECKNNYSRVREIEKILNEYELINSFDEELFRVLVEKIKVVSLIEVEFVLKTGVMVREIL